MDPSEALAALCVAVAAGGLIGAERQRAQAGKENRDFGGVRTFPLLALVGVVAALLRPVLGPSIVVALLAAIMIALAVAQARAKSDDVGVSSEIAAILTFGLGVLSGTPEFMPAPARFLLVAGIAAMTMALLALKRPLHGFVSRVSSDDVYATVKFVVLAAVVIPLLPNRTYGPLDVLNPRKIGLMITLVAGVSFAGYVASRFIGGKRGLLVAGLIGGVVSSTALTLALSGRAKEHPALVRHAGTGIVAACSTMFPRLLVIVAAVRPPLFGPLWLPLGAMAVAGYAFAIVSYRSRPAGESGEDVRFRNPFELMQAVKFGLIYGAVLFIAKAAEAFVGDKGIYASAALAGLADVDAITLSIAELHRTGGVQAIAAPAIVLASFVNTVVKAGLATVVGGPALGKQVAPALGLMLIAGGGALLLRALMV